jgi:hypothetical protein
MEFYLDWKFLVFSTTGCMFLATPYPFISYGTSVMKHLSVSYSNKNESIWYLFLYIYIRNPKLFWN